MIEMSLAEAARAMHAAAPSVPAVAALTFQGVGTDSRALSPGGLFVALSGPRFDGHAFLAAAQARGAVAAVVAAARLAQGDQAGSAAQAGLIRPEGLPLLAVADPRLALGALAAAWRRHFALPLVAVTGSNGKTTVKEMVAAILAPLGPVLANRGNLNNDIGLPLTLLGLGPEHRHGVVEMGANHAGEIAVLAGIARPAVAVVTCTAPAHLEGFGDLAGVRRAKAEIYAGLAPGGVAVVNAEDGIAPLAERAAGHRWVLRFGMDAPAAAIRAAECRLAPEGSEFLLVTPAGWAEVRLPIPGRHNIMNALAAAACAHALGVAPAAVAAGLAGFAGVAGRLKPRDGIAGARILDDTYNANPGSLAAGIEVLGRYPGRHWLCLGDMGELGPESWALHAAMGRQARVAGVERLFAVGELMRGAVAAFGDGAGHYGDAQALTAAVVAELAGCQAAGPAVAGITVLVKGSRAMRMEQVVAGLGAGPVE